MKNLKPLIIASFLFVCQMNFAQSKLEKGELGKGINASSEIIPGEAHRYKLQLGERQFAFLRLKQQGVDVKVTAFSPDGAKIREFNDRYGTNGDEPIGLTSESKGEYILEVSAVDNESATGRYDLSFERLQPKASSPEGEVDELFMRWNSKETPGVAVAVVKDGAVVYKNGYGMANLEYDVPVTPATVFHIASVSKQFTVFSVLLLEKEGLLSLDDDIRKHIPEVPDFGKTITLRHLASHTSGMRDQWNLLALAGWRLDDVITKEHVLKLVRKQKELNFEPGEEYVYCNTGFTLLAEVVSRVSGQSFADFTKTRIFQPLNMSNTLFYDDHEKIVKNRAYSYRPDDAGYKKSVLSYANVGATSLFTTVEDLSLWAMNFSDPRVGDDEILNKMNAPAVLNNGETFGGALGQFVGQYRGLNEIQHGGADAGYRSYLTRFPDQNVSVIVFSNDASFSSGTMAHRIADIYLKDQIQEEPIEEPAVTEIAEGTIRIGQQLLDSYVGEYELQPGIILSVTADKGQLIGKPSGQAARSLIPLSTDEFSVEGVDATIKFVSSPAGKVDLIEVVQGGQQTKAPRVTPFDRTAVPLEEFAGHFYSEELSTEYELLVENGKLIARHSRLSDIELNPVTKDRFEGGAWFFRQIEFFREGDKISGYKVSSGRVRDLVFRKQG